jgi:microcystin-dependent protein
MVEAYLGEVRIFAGDYAPEGWLPCNGQLLSINDYATLYGLIGTKWGGDGITTFALPDLRGRLPIGQGNGTGLTARALGQTGGTETVTLTQAQMPAHNHLVNASPSAATEVTPGPGVSFAATTAPAANYLSTLPSPPIEHVLSVNTIGFAGGNTPHGNVMQSFVVNFIICIQGLYPSRL